MFSFKLKEIVLPPQCAGIATPTLLLGVTLAVINRHRNEELWSTSLETPNERPPQKLGESSEPSVRVINTATKLILWKSGSR